MNDEAKPRHDTMLLGPVCEHVDGDLWGFIVIAGMNGGEVGTEMVSATNAPLLEATRSALFVALRAEAPWLTDLRLFDDELAHAKAGAAIWRGDFAKAVAIIENRRAGGGTA